MFGQLACKVDTADRSSRRGILSWGNKRRKESEAYGVIGIELRILDPSAEGVAPSRLGVAPNLDVPSLVPACLAGVSNTNFLNCELFIVVFKCRKRREKSNQLRRAA